MRLPPGTRDWLPAELRRKRAVESVLRGVFERWNYDEVQTPNFERFDSLEAGLGEAVEARHPQPPALHAPGPLPALAQRGSEMNIFQLAWETAASPADGSDRAGPRLAAQEGPLPGEEALFRRI